MSSQKKDQDTLKSQDQNAARAKNGSTPGTRSDATEGKGNTSGGLRKREASASETAKPITADRKNTDERSDRSERSNTNSKKR
jgi:hypothetical protein